MIETRRLKIVVIFTETIFVKICINCDSPKHALDKLFSDSVTNFHFAEFKKSKWITVKDREYLFLFENIRIREKKKESIDVLFCPIWGGIHNFTSYDCLPIVTSRL